MPRRPDSLETLQISLELLRRIPKGRAITAPELREQLAEAGFERDMRTIQRQQDLLKSGATTTLKSRHLTGHAVDLGAFVGGEVRWDWPLCHKIAAAVKQAAKEVGVPIEWGGSWKAFPDGPHFQLPWKDYP